MSCEISNALMLCSPLRKGSLSLIPLPHLSCPPSPQFPHHLGLFVHFVRYGLPVIPPPHVPCPSSPLPPPSYLWLSVCLVRDGLPVILPPHITSPPPYPISPPLTLGFLCVLSGMVSLSSQSLGFLAVGSCSVEVRVRVQRLWVQVQGQGSRSGSGFMARVGVHGRGRGSRSEPGLMRGAPCHDGLGWQHVETRG